MPFRPIGRTVIAVAVAGMVLAISGCATKRYGRLQPVSDIEAASYSCRELELEAAKCRQFLEQVSEEASIDGASVLGFLGDFGIGNAMERGEAEESARARLEQIRELQQQKGCR